MSAKVCAAQILRTETQHVRAGPAKWAVVQNFASIGGAHGAKLWARLLWGAFFLAHQQDGYGMDEF